MDLATLWPAFDVEDEDHDEFDGPPASRGGAPLAVTFPSTFLVSRVQIALGADLSADPLTWGWEDITAYVRTDLGISLTVGRRDEATQVSTGSGQLKLDNRDGRFTRRNPTGPYYGLLSKNTPIWITVDAGSGEKTRMEMFVNEWPNRWDKSGNDSTATIQCAGILRRLAQGQVLKSPLRRAITAAGPLAYWSLEDGIDATSGGSAIPSGSPMTDSLGNVAWAVFTGPPGSTNTPDLTGDGRLFAPVAASTTTVYTIEFIANLALAPSDVPVALSMTGGTYPYFWFFSQVDGVIPGQFVGGTPGVLVDNFGNFPVLADYDLEWHHYRVILSEVAGSVSASFWVDGVAGSGLPTAMTLGQVSGIEVNSGIYASSIDGSVAHVALYDYAMTEDHSEAMLAYVGEMAHTRIARLCAEEGVPYESVADRSSTMGPQGIDSLLPLIREAEAVGGGVLYEKRWGLSYQSLRERYNAPVGLALAFDTGQIAEPPEPADDDQRTVNKFTASRTDGSSYTAELTTGEMGTGSQGPGIYDDSGTFNVETDDQVPSQANWRVHLGTIDEARWPAIALNFAHDPDLIDTWCSLAYGARLTVTNPPSQVAPDPLDQIIEGHTEKWDQFIWTAALNCSPAPAYRVYVAGSTDGNLGRVDAGESTLAADATSTATTLSVASSGALWRSGAVDFDIGVGGEQMTVTDIGSALRDSFTRTVSAGSWGTPDVGPAWTIDEGTAANLSVNGSVGIMSHATIANLSVKADIGTPHQDTTIHTRVPVAPTGPAAVIVLIRSRWTDANNYYDIRVAVDNAGTWGTLAVRVRVAGVTTVIGTYSAGAYDPTHTYALRVSNHGTSLRAKFWDTASAEPEWQIVLAETTLTTGNTVLILSIPSGVTNPLPYEIWFDDITFGALVSPQTFTVVRSVNGVVKPQPATVGGFPTKVSLWRPGVTAL